MLLWWGPTLAGVGLSHAAAVFESTLLLQGSLSHSLVYHSGLG